MSGGEPDAMTRQEAGSLHRGTPEGEMGESPSPLKAFYFSRSHSEDTIESLQEI